MNNKDVCDYISMLDPHMSVFKIEYISDKCVKEGLGQSCGGYLDDFRDIDITKEVPSQKDHFLSYYKKRGESLPTYHYLRCPQLLFFIAEISGVPRKRLEEALEILLEYEDKNNLRNSKQKNGNYIWGKPEFREFKLRLHILEVVTIIRRADNWKEVLEKTKVL